MEEFFLCLFFSGNELHVVDNKDINVAVFIGKPLLFETDTVEEFFYECFRANIENA